MMNRNNPADIAQAVVEARRRGERFPVITGVEAVRFDTEEVGYCSRFVRLCHKAAGLLAQGSGPFSCCAHTTAQHLAGAGQRVQTPERGDIVVFTSSPSGPRCGTCGQAVWHVGISLGGGLVAENTSSGSRGNPREPGTKVSRLVEVGESRVWGYFRLWKAGSYADGPIRIKVLDVPYSGFLRKGVSFFGAPEVPQPLPVRVLEGGGFQVFDHIPTERTVYVYVRPAGVK